MEAKHTGGVRYMVAEGGVRRVLGLAFMPYHSLTILTTPLVGQNSINTQPTSRESRSDLPLTRCYFKPWRNDILSKN